MVHGFIQLVDTPTRDNHIQLTVLLPTNLLHVMSYEGLAMDKSHQVEILARLKIIK